MPRGGRRAGTPGNRYPNRSDLATAENQKKLPITTPTGQPYGAAKQQQDAQRQLPIAPPPAPPMTPPAGTAPQQTGPAPGELTPLHAPTARPDEPITAGLPIGAGPGPTPSPFQANTLTDLVNSLANQPGAGSDVAYLANYLAQGRR